MTEVFFLDEDPCACANALADQHVRSQMGGVATILACALASKGIAGPLLDGMWGKGNLSEGSVAHWAAAEWDHFMWLVFYGFALVEEHDRRFGYMHPASASIFVAGNIGHLLQDERPTVPSFWPSSAETRVYVDSLDYHISSAYQRVLRDVYVGWAEANRRPTWTNVYPPVWLEDTGEVLYTND